MIGYNCKYTPVEILACFDDYRLINNETEHFDYSSQAMHANVCSHIKAICEEIHRGDYDKLVFMNCCDSTRRLFDVAESKIKYKTILDLPIDNGACAVKRLKNDLTPMNSIANNATMIIMIPTVPTNTDTVPSFTKCIKTTAMIAAIIIGHATIPVRVNNNF